ncbi:hypothetical protein [Nostocoides australiense]|uniref:hypothetical protein n=1 Tax=Nostocoides australiense TaxID=99480 RepID=UPI000660C97A|nr:hypothetical protein [Tetrasphaera australiensis]
MILTDDFVFLHPPKTGGTFVAAMLVRLYPGYGRQALGLLRRERPLGRPAREGGHKHGPRCAIPASHAHLPVLATVRSPFETYVSAYEFREWAHGRKNPEFSRWDWDRVERDFPHFPDLSFADYIRVFAAVAYRTDTPDRPEIGWNTVRYANQFTIAPSPTVTSRTQDIVTALVERTQDVRFIHTENLNRDVYDALGRVGVPEARRRFILDAAKVLPTKGGRTPEQTWRSYYDDSTFDAVRRMDAAMLERFPEYSRLSL